MTEAQFQRTVIEAAQALGWLCYHTHDSRRSAAGFPDLVLVRDRVLFVELKTERGKLSGAQEQWRDAIVGAIRRWTTKQGAAYYAAPFQWCLWRPSNWSTIEEVLRG
jgi:hypothetical protein